MSTKKYLIIIGGPTASGKTSLAIQLAQHYDVPILSADSRQFYREMNIGTAKPTASELEAAQHHFINNLSIEDNYSVGDYEVDALARLDKIYQNNDIALMVGGSGLFIKAVCEGLDKFPEVPVSYRNDLHALMIQQGIEALQEELEKSDPEYYRIVDLNNPHRLIRALGVCRVSGQPFSSFWQQNKIKRSFEPIYILNTMDREMLYQRINTRVDQMIAQGLVEEAKSLYPQKGLAALNTVGYSELFDYFDELTSLEKAIELIKRNSRRYAKRQMTWLRRNPEWQAFPPASEKEILLFINEKMKTVANS